MWDSYGKLAIIILYTTNTGAAVWFYYTTVPINKDTVKHIVDINTFSRKRTKGISNQFDFFYLFISESKTNNLKLIILLGKILRPSENLTTCTIQLLFTLVP